jgi:hypothetical protein
MRNRANLQQFENKFTLNSSAAMQMSNQFNRGEFPDWNRVQNWISTKTGDPNIGVFYNQVLAVATEYMKIINAGSQITSAELSIGAQAKAQEILKAADNKEAFNNKIKQMQMDVQHQKVALDRNVNEGIETLKKMSTTPWNVSPPLNRKTKLDIGGFQVETEVPEDWPGFGGGIGNPGDNPANPQDVNKIKMTESINSAYDAIKQGADAVKVKARFKQNWGIDLPSNPDAFKK